MTQGKYVELSVAQRAEVWRRWKAGESLDTIGRAFDRPHTSIHCLLAHQGGIVPAVRRRAVKAAYDAEPGGHALHVEAAGLLRSFRVLNNLVIPRATNTITGGGGSVNFNYEVIHNVRLIANSFYSDGGGRYIFGLGPDAIVKPNGRLTAVHSGSGIAGLEYQVTPKNTVVGHYGGAYFQRNYGFLAALGSSCNGLTSLTCVGFGFPGSAIRQTAPCKRARSAIFLRYGRTRVTGGCRSSLNIRTWCAAPGRSLGACT